MEGGGEEGRVGRLVRHFSGSSLGEELSSQQQQQRENAKLLLMKGRAEAIGEDMRAILRDLRFEREDDTLYLAAFALAESLGVP